MTRSFAGTLGFGLLAGGGFPGFALLTAPFLGTHVALSLWLTLASIVYSALLGLSWRDRVASAFLAAVFVVPTALLSSGIATVAMGAALAVAIVRTRLLGSTRLPRAIALEVMLAALGFAFVTALGGPGWVAISLAIWGWFLVQSLYFLAAGLGEPLAETEVDPFDLATREVARILEDE
jgi:hypothetical protein